jgi:hypothetical protein
VLQEKGVRVILDMPAIFGLTLFATAIGAVVVAEVYSRRRHRPGAREGNSRSGAADTDAARDKPASARH